MCGVFGDGLKAHTLEGGAVHWALQVAEQPVMAARSAGDERGSLPCCQSVLDGGVDFQRGRSRQHFVEHCERLLLLRGLLISVVRLRKSRDFSRHIT